MIIDKHMISEQKVVGKTKSGDPVLYVMTHGGLFGFFTKNKDEVETLATAPHKAIAAWMAEKKAGGISWDEKFAKHEDGLADLKKSQESRFNRYRNLLFSQESTDLAKSEYYFVYDLNKKEIGLLTKDEISNRITKDVNRKNFVIRNASLNERPNLLSDHGDFS